MDKPRNIISLKGCIVDGVWQKDSFYTFTIRSLTDDELFYYLVKKKIISSYCLRVLLQKVKLKIG